MQGKWGCHRHRVLDQNGEERHAHTRYREMAEPKVACKCLTQAGKKSLLGAGSSAEKKEKKIGGSCRVENRLFKGRWGRSRTVCDPP